MKIETKILLRDVVIGLLILLVMVMFQVASSQTKYELTADKELLELSKKEMLANVGVKEATGNNDGKEIAKILKSVGINYPAPYCAAYIYYCFDEARKTILRFCGRIVEIPIPRSAVAQSSFNYAKSVGKKVKYDVKENDLITWKSISSWNGHTGRVLKVLDKGNVLVVEANTNNGMLGSQREGNGIFIRKRNVRRPLGRLRLRGLVGFRSKEL